MEGNYEENLSRKTMEDRRYIDTRFAELWIDHPSNDYEAKWNAFLLTVKTHSPTGSRATQSKFDLIKDLLEIIDPNFDLSSIWE